MNKKIMVVLFALFLLIGAVSAQYEYGVEQGGQEQQSWGDMGPEQKWDSDPNKFMREKGVNSISGALDSVTYDKGSDSITNGGVTLPINDETKGADIVALEGGGFKVTNAGKLNVGGNTYQVDKGQSATFNNDGTVSLQKDSKIETNGRTITAEGDVTIRSSHDRLSITGPATINTEDKRIVKGNDLTLYFSDTLPDKAIAQVRKGNQVYLAENNKFMLKGNAEISTTVEGITNRYKGEHPETLIWTGEGNIVDIRNSEKFGIRTTIARSWNDFAVKNTDTNAEEIKTIENRYVSKENSISVLSKATGIGSLSDASKLNYEITKTPNARIDVGDKNNLALDSPDFIKNNLVVNTGEKPKTKVSVYPTTMEEVEQEKMVRFNVEKGLATAVIEIKTDPKNLQELVSKYEGYSGPVEERNEDFIKDLVDQEEFRMDMKTTVKGGGATKALGAAFSFFGAETNPDVEVRKMLVKSGEEVGLAGQDLKNFNYVVGQYKVGGDPIVFDSSSNPNNPSVSVGKESRSISKDAINKIKGAMVKAV